PGRLALNSTAASLGQITGLIAPLAPALASRLGAMEQGPGPARLKLALDLDKNAEHADLDAPQLKGAVTITATPAIAAVRGIDLDALQRSEVGIESKLTSARGGSLLVLLGLDRTIAVGDGPLEFQGSAIGIWHAPLLLNVKITGAGLDAEARGIAEPWAQEPKAGVTLKVRSVNLPPLFDLQT